MSPIWSVFLLLCDEQGKLCHFRGNLSCGNLICLMSLPTIFVWLLNIWVARLQNAHVT